MTQITWFARLVVADGSPAAGVPVQLQVFDLKGGWTTIGEATTKADGRVRGVAGDAGPASGPAPMLRLLEADATPAVLGGVPTVSAAGSPPALTADFGELVHIEDRFTVLRASPVRMAMTPAAVAGVAAPAAARANVAAALSGATLGRAGDGALADTAVTRDLQTRLSALESERDDAKAQASARASDVQRLQADLSTNAAAVRAAQAERDDAKAQASARASDVQRLQADLSTNVAAVRAAQAERDDAKAKLAAREGDIGRVQVERDDVKARLSDAEKRLADVRATGTTNGSGTGLPTVRVGDFAARLGGEIDSAQVALKDRGFSLGPISVTARALVDDGGARITFPGRDDKTIPAGTLSDIAIQYNPSPVGDAAGSGVQVPDVRQLTESAARRVLASVGLALQVTQGPPAIDPGCAEGQLMVQAPIAGERAPRGTKVIGVFARKPDP